eukprot:TRINITY_DN22307_c0_g1_i1.p1 TRINITY_DN22307_c0_g1~~TRINITY_DN22307_c0_g1_i1.p1  ORF type:complete len:125 (-),score=15.70 TRINITY_DN22307_c0_g1_i1:159-533(-)
MGGRSSREEQARNPLANFRNEISQISDEDMKVAFEEFDRDHDGALTRDELQELILFSIRKRCADELAAEGDFAETLEQKWMTSILKFMEDSLRAQGVNLDAPAPYQVIVLTQWFISARSQVLHS